MKRTATLLLLLPLVACQLPQAKMEEAFSEDLRLTVGQSFDDLSCCKGRFLYGREPTKIAELEDGNVVRTYAAYKKYETAKGVVTCDVFLEFEYGTDRVTRATSEGEGCFRAY